MPPPATPPTRPSATRASPTRPAGTAAGTGGVRRGRPARISQEQIVDAAIALGLDRCTMAGVAEHLGVSTPALYSHVRGRDELLALVERALADRVAGFSSEATDWRGWLEEFAVVVRRELGPSAASLLGGAGHARPDELRVGEEGLALLLAAGCTPTEAAYAVWLVFRVALTAGPERQAPFTGFVDDTGALLDAGAAPLPATGAVHAALVDGAPHDTFAHDLGVVLDGLEHRLGTRPPANRPAGRPAPRPGGRTAARPTTRPDRRAPKRGNR